MTRPRWQFERSPLESRQNGGHLLEPQEKNGFPRVQVLEERVDGNGWKVTVRNDGSYFIRLRAYVTCL